MMGSAGGTIAQNVLQKVFELGTEIAKRGYTLVTGAAPGLPHEAVKGAKSRGGFVVGISPALNLAEHVQKYRAPTRGYDVLVYTGSGLMGREIENIRTCDVVIFAGGRSGTLGEFAIAYDEAKVIGALTGTGGITDHLETIVKMVNKNTGAIIRAHEDPATLLEELEEAYERFVLPAQAKVLAGHNPDGVLEQDEHEEREGSGLAKPVGPGEAP
jgi:uncharacterized protein (TIGR00725 family)